MNALDLIAQDLFDKVRSRFSNLQMGGEEGAVTVAPMEARFFDFDFVVEGNNLGRVSISINDVGTLKVYYSQGIVEGRDSITQGFWFDFLREMRQFAKRRMLRFDTRDISKGNLDKNDFAYLAQQQAAQQQASQEIQQMPQEPNMTESQMYGSSKSSYRPLEKTLLIIRHNDKVGEDRGARSRSNNINSIFIQNEAGERFKYPYVHLAGAKAMQRHVANGGTPFDTAGSSIIGMSEQIKQLSTFKRQVGNVEQLTTEARGIVDRVGSKLGDLRATLEHIAKQTHYESWRESLEEAQAEMTEIDAATIEDYKSKFTVSSYKEDLTQFFPLLFKVMQEASEVDLEDYVGEAKDDVCPDCEKDPCECEDDVKENRDAFEQWADEIAEGPNRSDVPAYLRKQKGEKPLTPKDIEDEQSAGKLSHAKTLAKNRGVKESGYYLGAEDLPDWTKDALHRVVRGEVKDWTELFGELSNFIDDDAKAERIAKMVFAKGGGVDSMAQHRVAPPDDGMNNVPGAGNDEDDDDSFLQRLRGQAKSGSIKPGVDTGGVESFDPTADLDDSIPMKEIAQKVLSHIDRETGGCPLGATAVGIQVAKEHGDKAGELAEKLVHHLQAKFEANKQMEAIRRLSGLPVTEAKKEKEPEGLYSKKRFETDSQRVARLAKEKMQAKKKETATKESTGDVGKPNTGKNKGFAGVVANAKKSGYSDTVAKKIAGKVKKDIMAKK